VWIGQWCRGRRLHRVIMPDERKEAGKGERRDERRETESQV
jgi:hypothetical protein